MYRLSNNRTEWYGSSTQLVKVDMDKSGKEKEVQVLFTPLTKKLGEPFLEKIAYFLNNEEKIAYFLNNKEKIIEFLNSEDEK